MFDHGRNQSSHHVRMAHGLSLGRDLDLENTKLLLEVLKIHSSQWIYQHIIYLFILHNILELHYSPLHHIPDIVILDLDML